MMPHLHLDSATLDREYPPLVAPEDDWLDAADEDDDGVFQAGMAIADNIRYEMEAKGRRREGADNDTTRRALHVGGSHMRNYDNDSIWDGVWQPTTTIRMIVVTTRSVHAAGASTHATTHD